jgi:hypothetical protein
MKVSIGSRIIDGPWGGGNLFVLNLKKYLIQNGHEVVHDLCAKDIDVILLTDPRSRKESSSTFNHLDILKYKKYVNPNVTVIQRINECDERKGTNFINNFYLEASKCADHIIFVSNWLEKIYIDIGMPIDKTSVIMSGADEGVFNREGLSEFNHKKIKIVTHHWSAHMNKGFDIYEKLDSLLSSSKYQHLKFSYIGNVPSGVSFNNTEVKEALSGKALANEIKKNQIYLTASINEPSGNHHIEAAQCGLPILYLDSGGIPEYCNGYGVSFINNFEESLNKIIDNYYIYKAKLEDYPFSAQTMCEEFLEQFIEVKNKKPSKEPEINKIIMFIFLFKNNVQKLFTSLNIKQYFKKLIKRIIQ